MNTLSDKDYDRIVGGFEGIDLEPPNDCETLSWIYFLAGLYMLEYYYDRYKYSNMSKIPKQQNTKAIGTNNINQFKLKYIALYCKLIEQYKDYYDRILGGYYKRNYKYTNFSEDEDFLYDLMTLNQEIVYYDFITLNGIKANTYEKLMFCYKHFIDDWSSKLIIEKLRKKTLNKLFIGFVNTYSQQSGLPQIVLLCYFYPLEEELNKSKMDLTKLNQYFTRIDIKEFLMKSKAEKGIFIDNTRSKRINAIDKWCNRIREKIIDSTIEQLTKTTFNDEVMP